MYSEKNYNRNVLPKDSGNLLLGSQTGLPHSTTESNEVMNEMANGRTIDFKHQNFSYPDKKQSSRLLVWKSDDREKTLWHWAKK